MLGIFTNKNFCQIIVEFKINHLTIFSISEISISLPEMQEKGKSLIIFPSELLSVSFIIDRTQAGSSINSIKISEKKTFQNRNKHSRLLCK